MAMPASAGKATSIRFPPGTLEIIRAATGRPAGEVIREMAVAYAERLRLERDKEQSNDQ